MNASSRISGGRRLGVGVLVLALAALACGGEVEPTATPLPRPTQRPLATSTSDAVEPTRRPSATPDDADPNPTPANLTTDAFDLEPYDHPSGAFSGQLPVGWERDEKDHSVFINSPDTVVAIELSYINVGQTFSDAELERFIQSVEDNWFATFPNYEAGDLEVQNDGSIGVAKTLELSGGTSQTVFSYYWQDDQVIYEQDFWVDTDAYDQYVDGLLVIANSMTTDPDAGAQADVYAIVFTFTGPNDYFEFSVPFGWTYTTDTPDNMVVDTFTSPDQQTFIENITYDDGSQVADLSAFARQLLTDYYSLDDLVIDGDDQPQEDGSFRIDWSSPGKGVSGETFYETRDTAVLVLTWAVPDDLHDLYVPVWSNLLSSYGIPEPE